MRGVWKSIRIVEVCPFEREHFHFAAQRNLRLEEFEDGKIYDITAATSIAVGSKFQDKEHFMRPLERAAVTFAVFYLFVPIFKQNKKRK